jgi:hypothetical protein
MFHISIKWRGSCIFVFSKDRIFRNSTGVQKCSIRNGTVFREFNPLVTSSWMLFWFVRTIHKYFDCSTFSWDLLAVFILWRDMKYPVCCKMNCLWPLQNDLWGHLPGVAKLQARRRFSLVELQHRSHPLHGHACYLTSLETVLGGCGCDRLMCFVSEFNPLYGLDRCLHFEAVHSSFYNKRPKIQSRFRC